MEAVSNLDRKAGSVYWGDAAVWRVSMGYKCMGAGGCFGMWQFLSWRTGGIHAMVLQGIIKTM